MHTIVVFSHLRWGFVYQRPQQLMSRLAREHRVLFIEEPVRAEGPARLVRTQPTAGVEVLCPHTPIDAPGFHDDQLPTVRLLIEGFLREQGVSAPLVWFYTPMALPLMAGLAPRLVVYDCMDELSAFLGAPLQLQQREQALMEVADLVLTGGPSLYQARRDSHRNIHCLPSAVDTAHFAPARLRPGSAEAQAAEAAHAVLEPGREGERAPRIGYFGVIDERLDLGLVAALAADRPRCQWVMAGPVVKIDPATLPRAPNLHWLGMQPYAVLPYLAAEWDVCMMPFALNDATRFISPTKTLEYLAAGKPVVSTAVRDVVQLYGDFVHVARVPAAFTAACDAALGESTGHRLWRQAAAHALVQRMTWDHAVATVTTLLQSALSNARVPGPTRGTAAMAPFAARVPAAPAAWPAPGHAMAGTRTVPLA